MAERLIWRRPDLKPGDRVSMKRLVGLPGVVKQLIFTAYVDYVELEDGRTEYLGSVLKIPDGE